MASQKRFVVEIIIAEKWTYYFGTDSRSMAESVGRGFLAICAYRIREGKRVIYEAATLNNQHPG